MAVLSVASAAGGQSGGSFPPPPPAQGGAVPPPPPPPAARQLIVYYAVNGQTLGPLDEAGLRARITAGEITRQTFVWMEGMADWQQAQTVQALAPLFVAVAPTPQFDSTAFMIGTWETRGSGPLPNGTPADYTQSVTYQADGSLSGFGTLTAPLDFGLGVFQANLVSRGTWKAEAKTDNTFILTSNMRVTSTTANHPPSIDTVNVSTLFTVIDRNTIAAEDGSRSFRVGN